MQAQTINT